MIDPRFMLQYAGVSQKRPRQQLWFSVWLPFVASFVLFDLTPTPEFGAPLTFLSLLNLAANALSEEMLFRRFLQNQILARYMGIEISILLGSLLFGLMHNGYFHIILAFLAGVLLSKIYEKTGRIWTSILLHGFLNILIFYGNPILNNLAVILYAIVGFYFFISYMRKIINKCLE